MSTVDVSGISTQVPSLLADCFDYIMTNALVEGIFRVSGSARRMKLVSADYTQYHTWLESSEKKPNAHDVAGVIKKYIRVYLDSVDGLFTSSCLSQLQRLYLAHLRANSDASLDSFKSANTSLGSAYTLPSVTEDDDSEPEVTDLESLLDSVSHLLITKNLSSKNELFIYLLLQLKELSLHEDQTKMSVANLSIIFQPYIFNTLSLSELKPFQNLLSLLVMNFDNFVQKYTCYKTILGGLEDLDVDNVSVTSSDSLAASPLTVYSSHQGSPLKNSGPSDSRRRSISNRLSAFWDTYNAPANRSKRFSLNFGSKSSDHVHSTENLSRARKNASLCPHQVLSSSENLVDDEVNDSSLDFGNEDITPTNQIPSDTPTIQLPIEMPPPVRPSLTKRTSSKRKSFIALFKSTLSVNTIQSSTHQDELSPDTASNTPQTPPVSNLGLAAGGVSASVDNLLLTDQSSPLLQPETKKLFGRALSMRLKRK